MTHEPKPVEDCYQPFEAVMPDQVARIVFGYGDDLHRLGWISAEEAQHPPVDGRRRPAGIVLMARDNTRLGTGILWCRDRDVARWQATELSHFTEARIVPVSTSQPHRRRRLEFLGLAYRPPPGVGLPTDGVFNRNLGGRELYTRWRHPRSRRAARRAAAEA